MHTSNPKYFELPNLSKIPLYIHTSCKKFKEYQIVNHILGSGSYGHVLIACENSNCAYVAKKIQFDFSRYPDKRFMYNMFFAESIIAKFAGEHGFGIPIKSYFICQSDNNTPNNTINNTLDNTINNTSNNTINNTPNNTINNTLNNTLNNTPNNKPEPQINGIIIMDKFQYNIEHIQQDLNYHDFIKIFELVHIMHSYGLLHRDLFLKNVMYKINSDQTKVFKIIDFGLTIPFEDEIPIIFRLIDFLNLISEITNQDIKSQCQEYLVNMFGLENVLKAKEWLNTHKDNCYSEYELLNILPEKVIKNYGPGTVDLLVWSIRCNSQNNKKIFLQTKQKIKEVESKNILL